jgi:hypothetical protein
MFSVKDPISRLLRWHLLLEEFNCTIEYKAGKKNVNADTLNRNPVVMTVVITSKEKQQNILKELHECPIGGHQVVQCTYDRLKLYVTWPVMFHDVEEYITNCRIVKRLSLRDHILRLHFRKWTLNFIHGTNFI